MDSMEVDSAMGVLTSSLTVVLVGSSLSNFILSVIAVPSLFNVRGTSRGVLGSTSSSSGVDGVGDVGVGDEGDVKEDSVLGVASSLTVAFVGSSLSNFILSVIAAPSLFFLWTSRGGLGGTASSSGVGGVGGVGGVDGVGESVWISPDMFSKFKN